MILLVYTYIIPICLQITSISKRCLDTHTKYFSILLPLVKDKWWKSITRKKSMIPTVYSIVVF